MTIIRSRADPVSTRGLAHQQLLVGLIRSIDVFLFSIIRYIEKSEWSTEEMFVLEHEFQIGIHFVRER